MSNCIEELSFGNIDSQAHSTKQNKSISKQMGILMTNETFLTETRTDDCKKKFLAYIDSWGEINCEFNLDSFVIGFRLGTNFSHDTFINVDTPFQDVSE